jgi:FMN-dependent oxidoreductase (nitrilotriacetate monooxygenase family)
MMHLGLFLHGPGHHIAAWRDPGVARDAPESFALYAKVARIAEAACFDLLFSADTNATFGPDDPAVWSRTTAAFRPEPLTLLAGLAAVTSRIGLVCTATTTYLDPYHVARMFASLDQMSGGRAGWNLVTSSAAAEALNFSHLAHPAHADRYVRAAEFADVVIGLWDSWAGDAVVADKASGQFCDPARMHFLNHQGPHFAVRGPLTVSRSPQGRPVVVQAGQSEAGRALAARTADIVFTVQQDVHEARAFRADMRRRAEGFGRAADDIKIMPGLLPFIGADQAAAEDKFDRLQALIHPELGVATLSDIVNMDLSGYPLDGPLPEVTLTNTQQGRQRVVVDMARREGLTIRQLYLRVAGARAHKMICGSAEQIADHMILWVESGAADGFNIMPPVFPGDLVLFTEQVIPILRARGMFRAEYGGHTLRDHLGLTRPENAFFSPPPGA